MRAGETSPANSSAALPAQAARSVALGVAFAVAAAAALLIGLAFFACAGYLTLLDYLEPRRAALAVGGGALVLALIAALIGRALVSGAVERLQKWMSASALVAIAPHVLKFGLRNARMVGLACTAAATYFALRGARKAD